MDEPFEKFEEDFEILEQSPTKATLDRMRDKLIHKMEDDGFRLLAIIDSNYPEQSWDEVSEVYEEVENIIKEEGDVVFMDVGRSITKDDTHGDASFALVENASIYDEAKVEVAKYYEGDYDFNDSIYLPAEDTYIDGGEVREARQKKLSYLGLKMKEVQKIDGNELKWVREPALTAKRTDRTYIWMTNAVSIPQPFNMRLPSWLIEVIRNHLTKTKL
mgnify:CR=1 FL=1|tara:strand:- start:1729 stop:2379 length:651 start_codon:yes stop_codon:yes gene_type:complete